MVDCHMYVAGKWARFQDHYPPKMCQYITTFELFNLTKLQIVTTIMMMMSLFQCVQQMIQSSKVSWVFSHFDAISQLH